MSPPPRLVNTFVSADVDPMSKIFIQVEAFFGLNRLPLIYELRWIHRVPMIIHNLILATMIITSATVFTSSSNVRSASLDVVEYVFCMVLSFITRKRLMCYFTEINRFDAVVGSKPKTMEFLKNNIILHVTFVLMIVCVFFVVYVSEYMAFQLLIVRMIHVIELYFYGHLFSLMKPRMGLINFHMEASLTKKDEMSQELKKKIRYYSSKTLKNNQWDVERFMEQYQILITAYDFLVHSIEWQFLVMLFISFMSTLSITYDYALVFLGSGKDVVNTLNMLTFISLLISNTFSPFAPCIYCDQLHAEVRRLRTLLASRLYENKMDKNNRSVARAMLALTKEHDLSLSLLGMLKIDISLPLKFMSLLLSYHIILLQFQKVIGN